MDIYERSIRDLDLRYFARARQGIPNMPMPARELKLPEDQYVLRMMIKAPGTKFCVPPELDWLELPIAMCREHQRMPGFDHPFVYVTVRSGVVRSVSDDEWHVDGFSMRVPHRPEQNYVWTDRHPTLHLNQQFTIPEDFDPLVHNLHQFFQDRAITDKVYEMPAQVIHMIDPYVVHRRPTLPEGTRRTFFRISFVPIEIEDDSHTINPLLPQRSYGKNGLEFRNTLTRY